MDQTCLGWRGFFWPTSNPLFQGRGWSRPQGTDYFRHNGAGEMLAFSAADFEDFRVPRPDVPPEMEGELEDVVRILVQNRWPWAAARDL